MKTKYLSAALVLTGLFMISAGCCQAGLPRESASPALAQLPRFTAPGVPALGPGETSIPPQPPLAASTAPEPSLPGKGLAQHPMLYGGENYNTLFLVNEGKVVWTYSTGKGWEYDDFWLLSNGNVLFSRMNYAEEVTPDKRIVWHLDCPPGTEIHSLQPIGLDRVMVLRNGIPPRLMIVNTTTGVTEVDHEVPLPAGATMPDVHGQFRRGRVTARGTYLISWLSLGQVVEYDREFHPIWSYAIRSAWAAVRLHNGNTLITSERDQLTREVNPAGETVWEFKLSELPAGIPVNGSQTCTRLANGNTVICSRGSRGKTCQLVEITPDKRVVWALRDWQNLGPVTAVQLLDEPGLPERPGDLQR